MSKLVKHFIIAACALLITAASMAAEDSNITVTRDDFGDKWYKEIVWFDLYDVGGDAGTNTYVYNEAEGTATSSGLVEARKYDLAKTIQIRVSTLGSTSIDARVEGRAGTGTNWAEVTTKNFTAGTSTDYIISAVEFLEEIRVGLRANGTAGTDVVTVTGAMLGGGR